LIDASCNRVEDYTRILVQRMDIFSMKLMSIGWGLGLTLFYVPVPDTMSGEKKNSVFIFKSFSFRFSDVAENGDAPFITKKIGNGKPPSDVVPINSPIKTPFEVPIFQGEGRQCMGM
jgi:hypothetical protein